MFIWLNTVLVKANDVMRRQAALKQDRSRRRCISLAALMPVHIGLVLLLLRKQQLWMNFLLVSTAAVPMVSICPELPGAQEIDSSHPCCAGPCLSNC